MVKTFSGIDQIVEDNIIFSGEIDEGEAFFFAENGAQINPDPDFTKIHADDTTVQEYSIFYVLFVAPVPIEQGCIVLVQIPDDFTVVEGNISMVQGWGIFGGKRKLSAEIDANARTVKIVDQCVEYSSAGMQSTIQLSVLRNPNYVRETKTFGINVMDKQSNLIASVNSFITYTPTSGDVKDISLVSTKGMEV
jgi:hypothetical protein